MKTLIKNKKLHLNYEVLDKYKAGVALLGHEVKSLKQNTGSLQGAFVVINTIQEKHKGLKYKVILRNLSIPPYQAGNAHSSYEKERPRELLLNKKEILKIQKNLNTKGVTIVPEAITVENGKIKALLVLVKGKKKYDKRNDIKKRDTQRDTQREAKTRFK